MRTTRRRLAERARNGAGTVLRRHPRGARGAGESGARTGWRTYVYGPDHGAEPADRGDVPGWVLVTLMTAALVSALWLVAGKALVNLFETAIANVIP